MMSKLTTSVTLSSHLPWNDRKEIAVPMNSHIAETVDIQHKVEDVDKEVEEGDEVVEGEEEDEEEVNEEDEGEVEGEEGATDNSLEDGDVVEETYEHYAAHMVGKSSHISYT